MKNVKRKVYLDSAATTYINPEVMQEMMECMTGCFGNASSMHSFGRDALNKTDEARSMVAKTINAKPREIYFTSGGTEANNWAIYGLAHANKSKGKHIITTKIEHESVLKAGKRLEEEGFKITYLNVDRTGLIKLTELMRYLKNDTCLVSIMTTNNEVGTIQYINTIARTCKEKGAVFHTDMVQAYGNMRINVQELLVDSLSISSHKIYGPKGVGALYIKEGTLIESFVVGGSQEYGKRGGTSNVSGIVGFAKAAEIAYRDLDINYNKIQALRNYLQNKITMEIPDVKVNGNILQRAPSILNVCFKYVDNESLLTMLDLEGIAVSIGSACTAGSFEPSHVLEAMGLSLEDRKTAIRFSIGKNISKDDIDYTVEKLKTIVAKLREISALNSKSKK